MADIKISVINETTVLKDSNIFPAVEGLKVQVHRDFAPLYGIDADLAFIPKGQKPPANTWWLVILDNSDVAGALGYHDTTPEGLPLGKVFAETDIKDKLQWSVTASHELLEMLADPEINLTVYSQPDNSSGKLYAYEVCDAVEADQFGYKIGNVLVSDFVLPQYFELYTSKAFPFYDFSKKLANPLPALLPGGYLSCFNVMCGGGWQQITGKQEFDGEPVLGARNPRAKVGSRRERRRLPRKQWLPSKAK